MAKLIMMKGLPASGKSTKAKEIIAQGDWVRINRDLLREMLHFGEWSGQNEGKTVDAANALARHFLTNGTSVVIDDCNLGDTHRQKWSGIAKECNAKFEVDEIPTSVSTCCFRDEAREKKVGRDVIRNMALRYGLHPAPEKGYVICDLDGTLCDTTHRLHHVKELMPRAGRCNKCTGEIAGGTFIGSKHCNGEEMGCGCECAPQFKKNWKGFFEDMVADPIRKDVAEMLLQFSQEGYDIVFVSGRPDTYKKHTLLWLISNATPWLPKGFLTLIMRRAGDKREDVETKLEILNQHFPNRAHIYKVIDDRPSVIRMWREQGLDVIDVGKGVEF